MPSRNQLTVYPPDTLADLIKRLAKEHRLSESKIALRLMEYAVDNGYDVKRQASIDEVERLKGDLQRIQDALQSAEETLKELRSPNSMDLSSSSNIVFADAPKRSISHPVEPRASLRVDTRMKNTAEEMWLKRAPYLTNRRAKQLPSEQRISIEQSTALIRTGIEHPQWIDKIDPEFQEEVRSIIASKNQAREVP
ncbi:MAG TPA: hypothetical protein VGB78_01415 [Thermoplasmata archaeon]